MCVLHIKPVFIFRKRIYYAVLNKSTKSASVMPFGVGSNNNQESISRDEFSKELSNSLHELMLLNSLSTRRGSLQSRVYANLLKLAQEHGSEDRLHGTTLPGLSGSIRSMAT
jgi:hypothetical protein